jgi:RNA polymerase sigma-70 factor (sigma-E family)
MAGRTTVAETTDDTADGAEPRIGTLEELYLRHAPEALRLAFLLTRDAAGAEDVVQEAFIRVGGRFRHLRSPASFDAYLRRTVVNLCMSQHRRRKIANAYLDRERSRIVRGEPATSTPDVETQDELRVALAALPDRQRAALVLRFYLDQSEEQTAATLGCSVVAARSLVHRAMQTLREQIGSEER